MTSAPDFSKEDLIGTAAEFAPGAWVCGHAHYPGGITKNMVLNNRCFVFKLKLKESLGGVAAGKDALFIWGLGNVGAIKGVKDLEEKTGLKAVALMCNGGGHHIYLKNWYDAFPAPFKIWVCPTKVPNTANGKRMQKEYPDRWELVDNATTPHHAHQLLKYFGSGDDMQVDCIVFNQLYGYTDKTSGESGCHTCPEHKMKDKTSTTEFFKTIGMLQGDLSQPLDDVVFYHKGSGLIVTGHHYELSYLPKGYVYPDELKFSGGFFFEKILPGMYFKADRYDTSLGTHVQRIRDFKVHAAQWQEVMKWDFKYACSHHDALGVCGPSGPPVNKAVMEGEGGVKGWMKKKLADSGELTGEPTYSKFIFFGHTNAVGKVTKKNDKFAKKLGEPALPMGGPAYDGMGFPVQVPQ